MAGDRCIIFLLFPSTEGQQSNTPLCTIVMYIVTCDNAGLFTFCLDMRTDSMCEVV